VIYNDVLAQMLYEDQKRKLNFITMKGWQLHREELTQAETPSQIKTTIQVHQCATC
jgi:hypothetical protein